MEGQIKIGLKGEAGATVSASNTAIAAQSGTLEVFGTPFMIALMESAAEGSLRPFLSEGEASVGVLLNVAHTAASPGGMNIRAESEVAAVDARKVSFTVTAFDEAGEIGRGTHERVIIRTESFMERARSRLKTE